MFIKWEKPDLNQQVKHITWLSPFKLFIMQQRNVTNFVTSLARFKFNGDGFQICNTEDDRCTIETCLEN